MTMEIATTTRLARSPSSQPFAFIWNAWSQMTGEQVRLAALFWLSWGLTAGLTSLASHPSYAAWEPIATGFYDTFFVTAALLLGVAVADAYPQSQAPHWMPYAIAALVADLVGTPLYVFTEPMVGLQCCWDGPRPHDSAFLGAGLGANFVICTLATFGYFHRRRASRRVAALRGAQLEREQLARRAFEARLQAMQARVEPRFLFNTLAQVESLYETDATLADRMLDDLIVYLRAALPQLRETASTVAREIELARAYLNVAQARKGDRLSLKVVMARDASDVRFPPMVLLPLIEHSIVHRVQPLKAGDAIGVGTRIENGKLCLTVTDSGARSLHQNPGNAALQGIRERLAALYGASASLSLDPDVDHGLSAVIKIPHERIDDRHHR
jgi:hypothetical protein